MSKAVVGVFSTYGEAAAVVRDLELAGIVGEQVQLISGADEEEPFADELRPAGQREQRNAKTESHGESFDDFEFYAGKAREGRAVVVVRPVVDAVAETAAEVLRRHGAKTVEGKDGPEVRTGDDRPETLPPRSVAAGQAAIGANPATTGGEKRDLEGRGQEIKKRA